MKRLTLVIPCILSSTTARTVIAARTTIVFEKKRHRTRLGGGFGERKEDGWSREETVCERVRGKTEENQRALFNASAQRVVGITQAAEITFSFVPDSGKGTRRKRVHRSEKEYLVEKMDTE